MTSICSQTQRTKHIDLATQCTFAGYNRLNLKDREVERRRETTDTETQQHRDTETQRHRDTETQRHRNTET